MKKLITLLLAGSTLAAAAGVPARYGIIPAPRSLEPAEGVFTLKSTTALTVEARDTLFREVAEDFARQVRRTTGYAILSGAERPRSRHRRSRLFAALPFPHSSPGLGRRPLQSRPPAPDRIVMLTRRFRSRRSEIPVSGYCSSADSA